jgi:GntP family gluconate:H+ symporter
LWNNLAVTLDASTAHDWFLLACAAGTVLLLLVLIARVRLHPALALAVAAFTLGVVSGMPLAQVPLSFSSGVGNLMGHIAIILALGAVLGRLLAASGGAIALSRLLVECCGIDGLPWALLALGILVGMPVFFEVGLVLLMPIVAEAARRSGRPPILVGLPVLAGLSMVHGMLPPHPAAMLAATQYHADLGRTILWGLAAGLPAAALAGPGLGWYLLRRWSRQGGIPTPQSADEGLTLFAPTLKEDLQIDRQALKGLVEQQDLKGHGFSRTARVPDGDSALAAEGMNVEQDASPQGLKPKSSLAHRLAQLKPRPFKDGAPGSPLISQPVGPIRAAAAILLPIALIFLGSWADAFSTPGTATNRILHFIGSPDIALLIAVLVALVTLGGPIQTEKIGSAEGLRKLTADSFAPIAQVLMILAAAGGLSGILRDSGAAQATVGLALGAHLPPLVLAWLLAAVIRVSMGSATVAMAVASSVLAPMAGHIGVRPELLVLATGSGSVIFSQLNDPGFWLIQSFFKLEVKETLATWSVLETVLSVAGLGMTLLLAAVLR